MRRCLVERKGSGLDPELFIHYRVTDTCCKSVLWKNALPQKNPTTQEQTKNPTLFPFTKLCLCVDLFFTFWLRLGQWICTAHAKHEVNHFPESKVRFQEASLSGALVSICHNHTKADASHHQLCTDKWFWDSVSFRVVLYLMAKCQQSTLNPVSSQFSWNKSWVFRFPSWVQLW